VLLDIYLVEDLRDLSFFIDQKCLSIYAHVLFAIHGFLGPDPVLFNDVFIGIGHEIELQPVLRAEFLMSLFVIDRDAEELDVLFVEFVVRITERARFERSTRCVVFRVKEQDHPLAFEVR
jgi:hypothetical protein